MKKTMILRSQRMHKLLNAVFFILIVVTIALCVMVFNLHRNYSELKAVYENQPTLVVFDWSELANIEDREKQAALVSEAKDMLRELSSKNAIILDSRYINAAPRDITVGLSTIQKRYESKK